ncbi:MAG: beta-ketoacyl-ACP synthase II [Christensenellales bacterium]|jgi:3-oxoacyl-[acyl-carrier-protein] synthase II
MKKVVITGMGIISPIGNSIDEYFESLSQGLCGIGAITRFDASDYKVKVAGEVKGFNPGAFGISPRSARHMDLFTQYALACAKQAVEESGIAGNVIPERFGVYVGSGIGGMNTFVKEDRKLLERGPDRISPFFIPMLISNIAAGTIAIEYGAQGPNLPVVTACATSTTAIGEAYRAIAHGYADAIIAGGSEATIEPLAVAGFASCQALSLSENPLEASLPFDIRRGGFVMGEGAGVLILEEKEHAEKRGAKIYAQICGYGNSCDAHHITAPRPDGACAARAISMAAKEAGISRGDSVYINAHGTGTAMNDVSETLAIKLALGEDAARVAKISSTKSMTGHMLGAAGAAEAIACVMAVSRGVIPPTIGLDQPDPHCDLDYTPNVAVKKQVTLALSTSLGFGGHNGCVAFRPYNGA